MLGGAVLVVGGAVGDDYEVVVVPSPGETYVQFGKPGRRSHDCERSVDGGRLCPGVGDGVSEVDMFCDVAGGQVDPDVGVGGAPCS